MTNREARELASRFWRSVADDGHAAGSFPRNIAAAVPWVVPVAVIAVDNLDTKAIHAWLSRHRIGIDLLSRDRQLRGCMVASQGVGALFVEAADDEAERRYTVAHELAHFLLEYYWPRHRAVETLGCAILPVLDGHRLPTQSERMNAILRAVPLGTLTHLMARDEGARIRSHRILQAEDDADRLALELLVPRAELRDRLGSKCRELRQVEAQEEVTTTLGEDFGLPLHVAFRYARTIVAEQTSRSTFRQWLRPEPDR
jgi:Zn-dependent peptidase ImmA (M78 family)